MKKLKELLFVLICVALVAACSESTEDVNTNDNLKSAEEISALGNLKSTEWGSTLDDGELCVTIPFKANFTVWNHTDPNDRACGEMPTFNITMKGSGVINHLGKITTVMTFCNNTETGEYWETEGVFVAANGDELYVTIPIGFVIPNLEDNSNFYSMRFNDDMYFVGGTGRFEGATGMAKSHAYVHLPTDDWRHKGDDVWHTDFFSTGELIVQKGKK